MILILFDAHRLDVSDELMEVGLVCIERGGRGCPWPISSQKHLMGA